MKSLKALVVLGLGFAFCLPLTVTAQMESHEGSVKERQFIAYRAKDKYPSEQWNAIKLELKLSGIEIVEPDSQVHALNNSHILVFERPLGTATLETLEILLQEMMEIPVKAYRTRSGTVYSVSSGYFFLKFKNFVPVDEARARLEDAGFQIVSPKIEQGVFIVVQGSSDPENEAAELQRLKSLPDIQYAATDSIPIGVSR